MGCGVLLCGVLLCGVWRRFLLFSASCREPESLTIKCFQVSSGNGTRWRVKTVKSLQSQHPTLHPTPYTLHPTATPYRHTLAWYYRILANLGL
ncbi:MAG: hypothetical protein F6J93_32030 [Oscillatoria sp. SIO1A7]|nr:hypothetical protein [Oscillatoria sp. SIO1A7]